MKLSALFILTFCVLCANAIETKSENVRGKRTLHLVLTAFADSLGYDVMKRPPVPPNAIAKPAGDRGMVNPALGPPMPPPKTLGQMPKAPAPAPPPPPPPPPMKPAPTMAPKPAPPPKPAPMAPSKPPLPILRFPTVPPLLTETVQKMFNINFNWNRNVQTSTPAPMAPQPSPKAPQPSPKAPQPSPKAPQPSPKAPQPPLKAPQPPPQASPSSPAPSQPPSTPPSKAPATPGTTAGPVKHVLLSYDYDDPQISYPQNVKDYDTYYQYDNPEVQQAPIQSAEQQKQPEQSQETAEDEIETNNQKQNQAYGEVIQNFWQNSPWTKSPEENQQEESRLPQIAGHNFVVNHPGGMSFSRMEHKKADLPIQGGNKKLFEPIYYYEEQQQSPLESKSQKLEQQSYHFQGPSFNQYFYVTDSGEKGKEAVEVNNSGENEIKVPEESRQKENLVPQAGLPIPTHNIYQENPFLQWISPFEASSEQKEQKIKVENAGQNQKEDTGHLPQWISSYEASSNEQKENNREGNQQDGGQAPYYQWIPQYEASPAEIQQKVQQNPQSDQSVEKGSGNLQDAPYFDFKYEPDHYNSDFTAQTIPPQSPEDYSKYESVPIKIENEFSDKVKVSEQGYGRKYTQVRADPLVKRRS